MSISKKTGLALGTVLLLAAVPAFADDNDDEAWPATGYGVQVVLGAGVQGFTDQDMRSTTTTGGLWDARAVIGTRTPIAFEGAYVGTAQGIDSRFGNDVSATLIGTGFEGALRLNLIPFENVTPFAFAGLGWKRYDVRGADFTTADTGINDEDNLLEIPLGGGIGYRYAGMAFDARFTYRAAAGEDLVITDDSPPSETTGDPDSGALGLDTWGVSANLGWEF
jgi:hypothetical protein